MKRDNDYMRELLLKYEAQDSYQIVAVKELDGSNDKLLHHVDFLCDAGLLTPLNDHVYRLTNQGHDFLESIRNESIWRQTKSIIVKSGGNATLDILMGGGKRIPERGNRQKYGI